MFTDVRKPPPPAWSEWKAFIFRNFLVRGYDVFPPIQQLQSTSNTNVNEQSFLQLQTKETLAATAETVQPSLQKLLQVISYPKDNGMELCNSIINGTLVGASDGSLKKVNGTYAGGYGFLLQDREHDKGRIVGCAGTPKTNSMTSMTSEIFGIAATALLTLIVYKQHQDEIDRSTKNKVVIYSDNKEAIGRVNDENDPLNVSAHIQKEYDIAQLIKRIQQVLPFRLVCSWVKGHQDELKNGRKIHGPFTREVQLNIAMDKLAKADLELEPSMRQMYPDTKLALFNNGVMITDNEIFLYKHINGEKLHSYISEKYGWERELMDNLDWEALGDSIKSYSKFKQKKIIQLLYDWQNDGDQKFQFQNDNGECPACRLHESKLHYLKCTDTRMREKRNRCLQKFGSDLKRIKTYPGLIAAAKQILVHGCRESAASFTNQQTYTDILSMQAIVEQDAFGENSFEKGFVTITWRKAQMQWAYDTKEVIDISKWSKKFVTAIQTYTRDMWFQRNNVLHGETESEILAIKKSKCQKRIRLLYKRSRKNLSHEDKKLFQLPLPIRLKGSVTGMTMWIEQIEITFLKGARDGLECANS